MKKLSLVAALLMVGILALAGCARSPSNLVITADMVRGAAGPKGPVCVLNNQYQRGESVTFRVRVFDPETGKQLPANPSDLLAAPPTMEEVTAMAKGIAVTANLSDGQSFPMHFGPHSPDQPLDYFWTVLWVIPENYPTGTIDYWITATVDSQTGRFDPFQVPPSKLTILE